MEEMPEVDGVLGTGSYTDIVPAVESVMAGDQPTFFGDIDHTMRTAPGWCPPRPTPPT